MPVLQLIESEAFGSVTAVDTATVTVAATDTDQLRGLQVNRLVALQSSKPGQHLIGIVQKIVRLSKQSSLQNDANRNPDGETPDNTPDEENTVRIALVGTLISRKGDSRDLFRRTLESVPEIDALCFKLEGEQLTRFMQVISKSEGSGPTPLSLGNYTLDENAEAFIDGNRFFQRHAVIVGSTGSGKSWTTARLIEQTASLPSANAILFDIHGEYTSIDIKGVQHLRIASPSDLGKNPSPDVLFMPFWLLTYELLISMLIDRSDQNAPNQAAVVSKAVVDGKMRYLKDGNHNDVIQEFTIDSPIPFSLDGLLAELNRLNSEMVPGARSGSHKQGDFFGKLSRVVTRLETRINDRRLGFMFQPPDNSNDFHWLSMFCEKLMGPSCNSPSGGGVKVIDCSEVPSDVLPLVIATISRLLFSVQQWTEKEHRHPLALICEEAHLYMPSHPSGAYSYDAAVNVFSKIGKEGRKYGMALVVVSQRPSEVDRTVLSQCNNFIALRLTNAEDQNVIQRLLPDSLGGFSGLLPILDTGEAIVVGDASLLPSRIRISEPLNKPASSTIDFWDEWGKKSVSNVIRRAVHSLRCQSHSSEIPETIATTETEHKE
ncbi:MAG: ATP-binding protein [Phycisphaerales bacterium JB050]